MGLSSFLKSPNFKIPVNIEDSKVDWMDMHYSP